MNYFLNNTIQDLFASERFSISGLRELLKGTKSKMAYSGRGISPASSDQTSNDVFVNGFIKATFPNSGLKKQFEQCLLSNSHKQTQSNESSDDMRDSMKDSFNKELYSILSQPQYQYIARDMNWSLANAYGNDIYTLIPSGDHLNELIDALKPTDNKLPNAINLLGKATIRSNIDIPIMRIKKVETVTPTAIVQAISSQVPGINIDNLKKIVAEIISLAENNGDNDKDRALNYTLYHNLAVYIGSYEVVNGNNGKNDGSPSAQLDSIDVLIQMSGQRKIAKIIFNYQNTVGAAGQCWYSAVDVTDEYPFLLVPFKRFLKRY